jgi:hypothetical protein
MYLKANSFPKKEPDLVEEVLRLTCLNAGGFSHWSSSDWWLNVSNAVPFTSAGSLRNVGLLSPPDFPLRVVMRIFAAFHRHDDSKDEFIP